MASTKKAQKMIDVIRGQDHDELHKSVELLRKSITEYSRSIKTGETPNVRIKKLKRRELAKTLTVLAENHRDAASKGEE